MNSQQIKDALDALGLTYRTETDGSLITDCPVCQLENKGAGKLKVFSDGRVACMRFAGTDSGEHRKEILEAFRDGQEKTSSERSAFITERECIKER